MNTMTASAMPPWIDHFVSAGAKVIFRWTRSGRARYRGYDPMAFDRFPDVVISGSVYRTADDRAAWREAGHIGDAPFFATWAEAEGWLADPDGQWESVEEYWAADDSEEIADEET